MFSNGISELVLVVKDVRSSARFYEEVGRFNPDANLNLVEGLHARPCPHAWPLRRLRGARRAVRGVRAAGGRDQGKCRTPQSIARVAVLCRRFDVVTIRGLKARLRERVLREAMPG